MQGEWVEQNQGGLHELSGIGRGPLGIRGLKALRQINRNHRGIRVVNIYHAGCGNNKQFSEAGAGDK